MIKRYFLSLFTCLFFFNLSSAQIEVVMRVDMSLEEVAEDGVYLVGSFQDWSVMQAIPLIDDDGDDIYQVSIELEPGEYKYSFLNGKSLDMRRECENLDDCLDLCFEENKSGEKTRSFIIDDNISQLTQAAYIFNSCDETFPASTIGLSGGSGLSIRPNPFSDFTSVQFSNPKNQRFDVLIYDFSGRQIRWFSDLSGNNFEIQRGDLATGIYLMTIKTVKGDVANRKLSVY